MYPISRGKGELLYCSLVNANEVIGLKKKESLLYQVLFSMLMEDREKINHCGTIRIHRYTYINQFLSYLEIVITWTQARPNLSLYSLWKKKRFEKQLNKQKRLHGILSPFLKTLDTTLVEFIYLPLLKRLEKIFGYYLK